MATIALQGGFSPASVLDPAAGYGNFLNEVAHQSASTGHLVGYETDVEAGLIARSRLWPWQAEGRKVEVHLADALTADIPIASFDLVICNPPYVRIHRLADKKALRDRFVTATGRFDLYFLFIELASRVLRSGGRLAVITSNKFMTTNAGAQLREHIKSSYAPLRIIDFKDASPFRAAVLTSIMLLERGGRIHPGVRWVELTRTDNDDGAAPAAQLAEDPVPSRVQIARLGADDVVAITEVHDIDSWLPGSAPWFSAGSARDSVLEALETKLIMSDVFSRFSVGIKSTADDVFVAPFDGQTVTSGLVEAELLHPLIRGGTIGRWKTTWDPQNGYDRYVLYPHQVGKNGRTVPVDLEMYPRARAYLEAHRDRLVGRQYVVDAGRRWYEIWVPQRLDVMSSKHKVVFPDFATRNTFALESSGAFVGSSAAFAVPLPELSEDDVWYVLFMLNSPVYDYLHKRHFGTSILAGRYRYWTRHVSAYPLPWPDAPNRSALADMARVATATGTEPPDHIERTLQAFGKSVDVSALSKRILDPMPT